MLTATCWNHSGVSWEHREMCEKLVPTCIKLYWSVFLLIAFVLSSILQECQVRSVESRANYFNVHSIFLGSCLAFESGNNQFVFLSSFFAYVCNTINIEINKQTTVQIPRENLTKVSTVDALNDLFAAKKKQTENTSCKYQTSGKKNWLKKCKMTKQLQQ